MEGEDHEDPIITNSHYLFAGVVVHKIVTRRVAAHNRQRQLCFLVWSPEPPGVLCSGTYTCLVRRSTNEEQVVGGGSKIF